MNISDPTTNFTPSAEVADALQRRDAQKVSQFEVGYSEVDRFVDSLARDYARGLLVDTTVYKGIVGDPAYLADIEGRPLPDQMNRKVQGAQRRYLEVSYLNLRGLITKLSMYCGVAWSLTVPYNKVNPDFERAHIDQINARRTATNQATAESISEAERSVETALGKWPELDIRDASSLHLHSYEAPWRPAPGFGVEGKHKDFCITCGVEIHMANGAWRDGSMKSDVLVDARTRDGRGSIKRLDHMHHPTEKGKVV
jgi:hypothetical protein